MRYAMSARPTIAMLAALGALMASSPATASGYCSMPMPPTTYLTKPRVPSCYNGCERYQIEAYRRDVDRYYEQLRSYLRAVDQYRSDAYDYARCMVDLE